MTASPAKHLRPIPAIDGVRGIAVAAVVLFHFPTTSVVKGGLFGVDVFFVLSGFLVTAGLLDAADAGRLSVGSFLQRRGVRLVPALLAFLALVTVMAAFFRADPWFTSDPFGGPGVAVSMGRVWKGDAFALGYFYNVAVVRNWHNAMPFAHLWTLGIEGQFYVAWAVLVLVLVRFDRRLLLAFTTVVVAASAATPWEIWHRYGDSFYSQAIIYFGTVPRLQQLFAGALLAQVWRAGGLDAVPRRVLAVVAGLCGAGVVAMFFVVGDVTFKYLGAETVVAAAACGAVAYLLDAPAGDPGSRLLSSPPLRWLGTRSYAIYLWHWPMAVWTEDFDHAWGVPLGIGASLLAAELSWRIVERPAQALFRRGRDRARRRRPETGNRPQRPASASMPAGRPST